MIALIWQTVIILLIMYYIIQYAMKVYRCNKLTASVPGWFNVPFIGSAYKFVFTMNFRRKLYDILLQTNDTYLRHNSRFRIWMGNQLLIILTSPEDMKIVNNEFIERSYHFKFGNAFLGNGLITAPAEIWKKSIKKVSGSFSGMVVDNFLPVFNAQSQYLVETLKSELGKPFDIMNKYLYRLTMETICQTAIGVSDLDKSIVTTEYFEAFRNVMLQITTRCYNILYHPDFVYKRTSSYRQMHKNIKILNKFSAEIIRTKKEQRIEKGKGSSQGKFQSFLDILLDVSEADPSLTEKDILDEVNTILASGQETSASSITLLLVMLANHPAVQAKVYAEVKEIFGDGDRPVEKEDFPKMKYCDAFINETVRLYPPVFITLKEVDKDFELDGCTLPKGCLVAILFLLVGRSRVNFGEDANEFRPERWLDGSPIPVAASSFGCGRRPCIGKRYAMVSMRTILVHLVRAFEFLPDQNELQVEGDLNLRPIRGHFATLKLRKP